MPLDSAEKVLKRFVFTFSTSCQTTEKQGVPENATFSISPCSSDTKRAITILFAASFVSQKSSSGSREPQGSIFTNDRDIQ